MILLLVVALILAWPTAGLSLVAYFAILFLRNYFNARIRHRRANMISSIRELQAGKGHPPSWVNDSARSSAFIGATISEATRKGVPQSFITNHFKSDEHKAALVCLVGLMEDKGASIRDQGIAATEFLCEMWKVEEGNLAMNTQRIRELLADASVRFEISCLINSDYMSDEDDEVSRMVEECLEAARQIREITGQDVKDVMVMLMSKPQPA